MCGLNGIFVHDPRVAPVDAEELERSRDQMEARGPDGAGLWLETSGRMGLGHRRLSILDLSEAGAQPLHDTNGRHVIVFNGEIYNYRDLRADLEARGETFASTGDTEVLLRLFVRDGVAMLPRLRGMFALAIWDRRSRTLTLARDPYGIKPLYWADHGGTFRFASQVGALAAGGALPDTADPASITGFLLFGSVPEPFTALSAVRALPAGSVLQVTEGSGPSPVRCFRSLARIWAETAAALRPAAPGEIRAALLDSVRAHLVADVPVGAFLSAGIDSGALVGLMRDAGQESLRTLTLGFAEYAGRADDEIPLAAEVARHYRTDHTEQRVDEAEFRADLPAILTAMDQPTIDGVNSWFVSKATRAAGLKVAVSGLGGDELFGGYRSFRRLPRLAGVWGRLAAAGCAPPPLRALLARLGGNPKLSGLSDHAGTWAGAYLLQRGLFLPAELTRLLPPELLAEGLDRLGAEFGLAPALDDLPAGDFARVAALEAQLYMRNQLLRDTDWASMAHSLEVRVPLVDSELLAQLAPVLADPGRPAGKATLAAAPTRPLPAAVANRPKTGFTTPVGAWQRALDRDGVLPRRRLPALPPGQPWARHWALRVAAERFGDVFA